MGIGYFQLTVISEHDKYLVGNPQFTYFKAVYKRHTNFAIENFMLNFVGETSMGKSSNFNKKLYTIIPKNGDLVHRMYLVFDLTFERDITGANNITNINNLKNEISVDAQALIEYIEVKLGDQVIDRHTGEWLHISNEVTLPATKNNMLCDMINTHINIKDSLTSMKDGLLYIPLQFWFNKNPGLALPLLALEYSSLKIDVKLNSRDKIRNVIFPNTYNQKNLVINNISLLTEYIHLDTDEKNLFASNSHEYLIEQLQYTTNINVPLRKEDIPFNVKGDNDYTKYQHKFEIPFNHPIKQLFWAIQDDSANKTADGIDNYSENGSGLSLANREAKGNNIFNYWFNLDWYNRQHQMIDFTIGLNGSDMFEPIHANYFMSVLKYQYHSGIGYGNLSANSSIPQFRATNDIDYSKGSGFYTYSFALKPQDYQPSGSLNFSKLDRAELKMRLRRDSQNNTALTQKMLKVYAINYNILRIMSGHAGLAFSN